MPPNFSDEEEELEIQPDPQPQPQRVTRRTANQQQQTRNNTVTDTNNRDSNIVEVPDWVQKKLNDVVLSRTTLVKEFYAKHEAIKKLKEHQAQGTFPKSILPTVKLHVKDKYQNDVEKFLDEENKKYATNLLIHLVEIREKEVQDLDNEIKKIRVDIRKEILDDLTERVHNGIDIGGRPTSVAKTYMDIYDLEKTRIEDTIRTKNFEKKKKQEEDAAKRAEEKARREAESALSSTGAMEKVLEKITNLEKSVHHLKGKTKNNNNQKNQQQNNRKNKQPNNNQQKNKKKNQQGNAPKGQGRGRGRHPFPPNRQQHTPLGWNLPPWQAPPPPTRGRGRGRGNPRRPPPFTNSMNPLGYGWRNYHPMQN